jgi:hypothetical protein
MATNLDSLDSDRSNVVVDADRDLPEIISAGVPPAIWRAPMMLEHKPDLGFFSAEDSELSSKIAGWEPTPANLKKARVERLKIERDEPPVKRLVDFQAYNEELRATGKSESSLIPLSIPQRWFGYMCTFGIRKIEKWKAAQEATN